MCVNFQGGGFIMKPIITTHFTIPSVFWEEKGFFVLAFGSPSTGPDSIDSHNYIKWL